MTAVITCPTCNASLAAAPELAGSVVSCPRCRQAIQLVEPTASAPLHSPAINQAGSAAPAPPPWAPAIKSESTAAPVARARNRPKPFPYAAAASWAALLGCVIVPAIIIWYLRANHRPAPSIAEHRPAAAPPTKRPESNAAAAQRAPAATATAATPGARPELSVPGANVATAAAQNPASTPASETAAHSAASRNNPPPAVASGGAPPLKPSPANLFATIGEFWQLPALISTAPAPVGQLAAAPVEPLQLFVKYQAADIPEEAVYFAKGAPDSLVWTVSFLDDLQNEASQAPLAEIRLEGAQFTYTWLSSPADIQVRRQLANCLLEIQHGGEQRQLQFRSPNKLPLCRLDLNLDVQKYDIPLAVPPKSSSLRLEVGKLIGFPEGATVSQPLLEIGQDSKIEFADPAGAEIEIRFRRLPAGELMVQLEPVFRENRSRKFEMTIPRLDAMETGARNALREAEQELSQQKSRLSSQQSALRKLQNSPPSNPTLLPAWKGDIGSAEAQIKRTAGRITTLQKQIPTHKARLAAVPTMRQFLTNLNGQASIPFRLLAKSGDRDILLAAADSP